MRKLLLILLLLVAAPAWAQTATWIDSGGDATTDTSMASTTSGTVTVDAVTFHTGPNSYKIGTGAATGQFNRTNVLADAGRRCSIWYNFPDATPATNTFITLFEDSAGATNVIRMRLNTTGKLEMLSTASLGSEGATVLSDNTWTRIGVSYTISGTTANITVRINGNTELTLTGVTLANASTNRLSIRTNVSTTTFFTDDIWCDDGTDLGDPGDIRVTAKRPISNGTTNEFTTEVGAGPAPNGIGTGHAPNVSERPLSTTYGWALNKSDIKTEEYNIQTISAGDVDITGLTIKGVLGWVRADANPTPENGSIMLQGSSSGTIALTSTAATFFKIGSATYPAGTGTDIGLVTDTTANIDSLYEAGIVIGYLNGAAAACVQSLMLLGAGGC